MTGTVAKTSDGYKRYGLANDGLIKKLEGMGIKMEKASQAMMAMSQAGPKNNNHHKKSRDGVRHNYTKNR